MATTATEMLTLRNPDEPGSQGRQLSIEEFVKEATWRELLLELVESDQLDPWNIDIAKVVDGYISAVKRMKVLDLHVPANIILAASILLRLKSETLRITEPIAEPQEEEAENVARVIPEVQSLTPRLRMQPNRRITLSELMEALDEAIKLKDKREMTFETAHAPMQFVIDREDIDAKIEHVYLMVRRDADQEGVTTFANLANRFGHMESILLDLFIPLLFLAHKGRVVVEQEKFFDEIFIRVAA